MKKQKKGDIIKLDYDNITERQLKRLLSTRKKVLWFFKLAPLSLNCFKTNHGYHVYITTNKHIQNKDLVFIQLALGSDFYRECFYWKRVKYPILPHKRWNILFQKKYYNNGTTSQETIKKRLSLNLFKLITTANKKQRKGRYKKWKTKLKRKKTKKKKMMTMTQTQTICKI